MNTAEIKNIRLTNKVDSVSTIESPKENFESSLIRKLFYVILFLFPLFFGGVHSPSYIPMYTAVLMIGAYSLHRGSVTPYPPNSLGYAVGRTMLLAISYLTALFIWGTVVTTSHPIIGVATTHIHQKGFILSLITIIAWCATWHLSSRFCSSETRIHTLLRFISLSGFIVASVALSHWFYDTGKLFGIFEPNSVTYSNRARWPFVSSNNLGQFLVISFFPTLYLVLRNVRKLLHIYDSLAARRSTSVLDLINNQSIQPVFIAIAIDALCLLGIALAILGSQSRGSWIGLSITLFLFVIVDRWLKKDRSDPTVTSTTNLRNKRRMTRPLEGLTFFDSIIYVVRRFSLAFAVILSASLIYLYLQGRGLEMVLDRAEYGLLASKDDIRWVMYGDTLGMIKDHPLFGVGLGAWDHMYALYASPELARLNPVYLHSDPLQLFAEVGIIGIIPFVFLFYTLVRATTRVLLSNANHRYKTIAFASASGLVALFIASLFDFPFRMPSIVLISAILLGILTRTLDTAFESSDAPPENVDFFRNNADSR